MSPFEEEKEYSGLNQSMQAQAKKVQELSINIERATKNQRANAKKASNHEDGPNKTPKKIPAPLS